MRILPLAMLACPTISTPRPSPKSPSPSATAGSVSASPETMPASTSIASAYPKYTLVRHAFSADLSTPCKDESDQKAFSTNSPMILFIFEDLQKYLKEMIPMTLWLGVKTLAPAQTTLYQTVIDSIKVGCNVEIGVRVRVLIYALVVHLLLPAGVPFYLSSPHAPTCSRRAEILQVFDLQLIA